MKTYIFPFVGWLLLLPAIGFTQDQSEKKLPRYRIVISYLKDTVRTTGILEAVTDSSVILSTKNHQNQRFIAEIPASDIKRIKIRKKGTYWKGYGIGLATISGIYAVSDDVVLSEVITSEYVYGLLIMGLVGIPFAEIFGSKRYKIKGNETLYWEFRESHPPFRPYSQKIKSSP